MLRRFLVSASVSVVVALLAGGLPSAAAAADVEVVRYSPPVDAVVVDRFDPPERPWLPGNRGIDYDAAPGAEVRAAADGEVVFAGDVGGALHVTVRHADGLRTSYSFLATVLVARGQRVSSGQPVGTARGPVHFGVRAPDGTYLDPEALLAGTLAPRVRLVPSAEDGLDPLAERRSLLGTLLDQGAGAVGWLADHGVAAVEASYRAYRELQPSTHLTRGLLAARDWVSLALDCTPGDQPAPPPEERRIVVLVSGLGTTHEGNSTHDIDTAALGYDPEDVVRFSYQGGQAPSTARNPLEGEPGPWLLLDDPTLDDIEVRPFGALDSQQSLDVSAERLADLLAQVHEAEPDVPIDVVGHSQGGVVARMGVLAAEARGGLPGTVENLVTVSSPHQGAPLASGVEGLKGLGTGEDVLALLRASDLGPIKDLDDRAPAIGQLSEGSAALAEMRATPVPDGVRFTTVNGSGDPVVPGVSAADPRADANVSLLTVPSLDAHGDITKDGRVTREMALALAGAPPTCQHPVAAALAFASGDAIHTAETLGGSAATFEVLATDAGRVPFEGFDPG